MPNRIIREGWVESETIDALSVHAECFFLRLCLKADDFGRYHANPQLLKSNLFPLKEDVRNTDISRWLAECEKAGLIRCYSQTSRRFLEIPKFGQRCRAEISKFPDPANCQADVSQPHDTGQSSAHVVGDGYVVEDGDGTAARRRSASVWEKVPEIPIPASLDTDRFRVLWAEWIAFRRTLHAVKDPVTMFHKQLEVLEAYGVQGAEESLRQSMANGWRGLFPPKGVPRAQNGSVTPSINSIAQADSVITECAKAIDRIKGDSKSYEWDGGCKGSMKPEQVAEIKKLRARQDEMRREKTRLK